MSQVPYEQSQLYKIRHSLAHVMAQAVLEKFPDAQIAIGPPIEDGFYYDFKLPRPITDEDVKEIEKRMRKIVSSNLEFLYREVSADEARTIFAGQPFKLELIDGLANGRVDENGNELAAPAAKITLYTQGNFTDLCKGPHVANTKEIDGKGFSITYKPVAGAYWRGNSDNEQLTRIYGTAWESSEALQEYLTRLEEARKRDHRVLGEQLNLFTISPIVGKGLILWKPKGALLRDLLERWERGLQADAGYQHVVTPHIGSIELYKTSGHYPYYADSQFSTLQVDEEEYMLKPMNCPHHIMIYRSDMHSYRDLPLRLAEFGTVYRYEQSGELSGLTRVRGFTQDDAHLFVTPDQLLAEFKGVVGLFQKIFGTLGIFEYRARVGTRDPKSDKYVGDDAMWENATNAIIQACDELGLNYTVEAGEAAFYGPKLDLVVRDVLKRDWQLGTVQVDYNLPERFKLEYVAEDNSRQRPIMIHRAMFGSVERFMGILIEHFGGAFPAWLSPVQVEVIPVTDEHVEYAYQVAAHLKERGFRPEVDAGRGRMQGKIRAAREQKIPYILVVGGNERDARSVAVRLRTDEDLGVMTLDAFTDLLDGVVKSQALELTV
ncbi:MAG: threonine--tRNA ligase [Phototrophicaceae bacterium]|jgi:threonyl-tRNA synthetase